MKLLDAASACEMWRVARANRANSIPVRPWTRWNESRPWGLRNEDSWLIHAPPDGV